MNEVKTTLKVLIDSLTRKKQCLEEIIAYSKEQEAILKAEEIDYKDFSRTVNNKQILIDQVVLLDNGFKPEFERIKGRMDARPDLYKEEIQLLKKRVKEIGDLGVSIQVMEKRNRILFDNGVNASKGKVKTFKKSKQAVTNYYSNMNKQKKVESSFFYDTKK